MAKLTDLIINSRTKVTGSTTTSSFKLGLYPVTLNTAAISGVTASATPGAGLCTGGQVQSYLISVLGLYDSTVYTEPDGSHWLHIFHHNNPTSYKFSSGNVFRACVHTDANRYFDIGIVANLLSGSWEIIAVQQNTSGATPSVYRWIQSYNPITATYAQTTAANITKVTTGTTNFNSGATYTTMNSSYGGIYYNNNSNSFIVQNSGTNGNWWGSTGCWTAYQGGIPGYNGSLCTSGCMDLYMRIDNTNLF